MTLTFTSENSFLHKYFNIQKTTHLCVQEPSLFLIGFITFRWEYTPNVRCKLPTNPNTVGRSRHFCDLDRSWKKRCVRNNQSRSKQREHFNPAWSYASREPMSQAGNDRLVNLLCRVVALCSLSQSILLAYL